MGMPDLYKRQWQMFWILIFLVGCIMVESLARVEVQLRIEERISKLEHAPVVEPKGDVENITELKDRVEQINNATIYTFGKIMPSCFKGRSNGESHR